MKISKELTKGSTALLVLSVISKRDMYGYQIAHELKIRSGEKFVMPEGSLYPTLYRLIEKGVIADRVEIVGKRLRKYYHLVEPEGKEYLKTIRAKYDKISQEYPQEIIADRETAELFRKQYVDGHPVILEGWNKLL